MPVELRKRKAAEPAAAPPAKKQNAVSKAVAKVKAAITSPKAPSQAPKAAPKANGSNSTKVAVGQTVVLESFGGEVETNDGQKTNLKKLVDESKAGVVLFTYPKASTPGCTTQACLFRDSYAPLTATGLSIFGLSTDSPKSNTTFKTKQNLPYTLLCDPNATLIAAIGFKKAPKGTTRGVFVVDKSGKVLAAESGGPAATVDVVKKLVGSGGAESVPAKEEIVQASEAEKKAAEPKIDEAKSAETNGVNGSAASEDVVKANVAADVADTAEKLDSNEAPPV